MSHVMATFFDWYRAFNREAEVSPAARAVGNAMATRADQETLRFWITIQEVAHFTRVSSRHVINKIDELTSHEWVVRTRRGAAGRASEYRLTLPKVNDGARLGDGETCTIVPTKVNYSSGSVNYSSDKGELECTPTTPKLPHTSPPKLSTSSSMTKGQRSSRYTEAFEAWWKLYPKKVGKGDALKAWTKATKDVDPETLESALEAHIPSMRTKETRFVPNPATWLNQGRYDDDVPVPDMSKSQPVTKADRFKQMAQAKAMELTNQGTEETGGKQLGTGHSPGGPVQSSSPSTGQYPEFAG